MCKKLLLPLLFLCILLVGCHQKSYLLEPEVCLIVMPHHIGNMPPSFPPLTDQERRSDWGKELIAGNAFGKELDLYRALTCYKRALYFIPPNNKERKLEIEYEIVFCYYLGGKYCDAINSFNCSDLALVSSSFPPYRELLILLHDCFSKTGDLLKADHLLKTIQAFDEGLAQSVALSEAVQKGDLCTLFTMQERERTFAYSYCSQAKSVKKAQWLNALCPGLGYAYVGQKQSACTSFVLNGLFIAASYYFFHEGNIAAGLITSSLEFGWYVGGINGAGLEAKAYNEALYRGKAHQFLCENRLFPVLMFHRSF